MIILQASCSVRLSSKSLRIYTSCYCMIIPVLFNCVFGLTHSKDRGCVNMCVYRGCGWGSVGTGRAGQGSEMAWIGQLQPWKAPKRPTALVMAAVVTSAVIYFILNTVQTARNTSVNSCSAGQWVKQWISIPVLGTPCFAHFACLPYLTHLIVIISLLGEIVMNWTGSEQDWNW